MEDTSTEPVENTCPATDIKFVIGVDSDDFQQRQRYNSQEKNR